MAFSYAETSDDAWDKFETEDGLEIVILEVDTTKLDPKLFKLDSNVVDNEGDTVEYHGVVPPSAINATNKRLAEAISLDIEVGDILLGGKYKNKRIEVKEIGEDELGQPTVNGNPILKVRIEKHSSDDKKSKKTLDAEKDK